MLRSKTEIETEIKNLNAKLAATEQELREWPRMATEANVDEIMKKAKKLGIEQIERKDDDGVLLFLKIDPTTTIVLNVGTDQVAIACGCCIRDNWRRGWGDFCERTMGTKKVLVRSPESMHTPDAEDAEQHPSFKNVESLLFHN